MAVMSTSQTATGGVKNLRAIFEHRSNDLSTSPPSRGRSPNRSVTSSHDRPLSKVRTSFVTVEKPGSSGGPPQLGLRKTSGDLDESVIVDDMDFSGPGLGAILKGSPFEEAGSGRKPTVTVTNSANTQAPKANGSALKENATSKKVQEDASKAGNTKPNAAQPQAKSESSSESKKTPVTPSNPTFPKPRGGGAKIQAVMESAREAQEARAAAALAKPDTIPKPRGGGAKIQAVTQSAKEAQEARAATAQAKEADATKKTTPATTKAPRASLPARLNRPAGSATAPTASSVAKNENSITGEQKPTERKPLARGPPRVANATTASSLAKKSSRASLGMNEQPKPRTTTTATTRAPADEGFLARMMRPTASSAQKTHDKVQAESPPRQKPTSTLKTKTTTASRKSAASTATQETDGNDETEPAPETAENVDAVTGVTDVNEQIDQAVNGDNQQQDQQQQPQPQPQQQTETETAATTN